MDFVFAPPILPISESFSREKGLGLGKERGTDTKIKGYFLEKLGQANLESKGALLPTTVAPRVMINILSAFAVSPLEEERVKKEAGFQELSSKKKKAKTRKSLKREIPIGLKRCTAHDWINSWMQFLLFLPSSADVFSFLPRSFDPFREFADQYTLDQQEGNLISFANSANLVRCLLRTLPFRFFQNPREVELYEILREFIHAAFFQFMEAKIPFSNAIFFHLERHLIWNSSQPLSLEKAIQQKIEAVKASEFLVSVEREAMSESRLIKRQHFIEPALSCYELDAFIEHRPDTKGHGSYATYLKVEGVWYQCDHERVLPLLSTSLGVALHRSVLLHYQKVSPLR